MLVEVDVSKAFQGKIWIGTNESDYTRMSLRGFLAIVIIITYLATINLLVEK